MRSRERLRSQASAAGRLRRGEVTQVNRTILAEVPPHNLLSSEVQLALSPTETYRQLLSERTTGTIWTVLARPAFSILFFGTLVAIASTGHVTIPLVSSIGLSWSFLLLVQAAAAAVVILSARERRVSRLRAFELLFLGHAPWSFCLLAMTAFAAAVDPSLPILAVVAVFVIPVVWTAIIIAVFCQTILGMTKRQAQQQALLHQLLVWGAALGYVWFAVGGWTPILQTVGL
jgi:hypothetical protein